MPEVRRQRGRLLGVLVEVWSGLPVGIGALRLGRFEKEGGAEKMRTSGRQRRAEWRIAGHRIA